MYDLYSNQLNDRVQKLLQMGLQFGGARFAQPDAHRYGEVSPATGRDNSAAFFLNNQGQGLSASIGGAEIEENERKRRMAQAGLSNAQSV